MPKGNCPDPTGRETGKETGRETERETERETGSETERETGRETGSETPTEQAMAARAPFAHRGIQSGHGFDHHLTTGMTTQDIPSPRHRDWMVEGGPARSDRGRGGPGHA